MAEPPEIRHLSREQLSRLLNAMVERRLMEGTGPLGDQIRRRRFHLGVRVVLNWLRAALARSGRWMAAGGTILLAFWTIGGGNSSRGVFERTLGPILDSPLRGGDPLALVVQGVVLMSAVLFACYLLTGLFAPPEPHWKARDYQHRAARHAQYSRRWGWIGQAWLGTLALFAVLTCVWWATH